MTFDHATLADTILVSTARGAIEPHDVRGFGGELDRRLTPAISHVVLDVRDLAMPAACEPAIIAALLSARRTACQRGASLTVVATGEPFDRLVRTTALDELVTVAPSIEGALEGAGVETRPGDVRGGTDAPGSAGGDSEEGRVGRAEIAVGTAAGSTQPAPMRCVDCGTTWFSRVAPLVVQAGFPCARCGGRLAEPPGGAV